MQTLELLQLMKGPTQLPVARRIIRAVNAGRSVIPLLQGHCGIRNLAAIVCHFTERVVNVSKKPGSAAGLNVLHLIAARPGGTLVEIPDYTKSAAVRVRCGRWLSCDAKRSNHQKTKGEKAGEDAEHWILLVHCVCLLHAIRGSNIIIGARRQER